MKNTKVIYTSGFVLVIACFVVFTKYYNTKDKNQKIQQNTQEQVIAADAYVVKHQTLPNEIKTIGSIRANEEVELRSELYKKVVGIYFKEGSYVSKSRLLFKLDDADLQAKLKRQEVDEKLAVSKRDREKKLIEQKLTTELAFETLENDIEKIRADIEMTKVDISKTKISAPFSGIIGFRHASIGSFVDPDNILATIQDISKLKVDFSIPEKYSFAFKVGQEINFTVEGFNGNFNGEVYASEPKVENNTRSLVLSALTSNHDRKLIPGNFANVTLILSEINDAIMIPTQALIPQLKGQSVFVFRNGSVKSIDVETGLRTEEKIQITSGLNENDTVITTNLLRLKSDARVRLNKIE